MQSAKLVIAGLIGAAASFVASSALNTRAPAAEENSGERRTAEFFSGLYSMKAPNGRTYWINARDARDCYCNWAMWTYGAGREVILECGVVRTNPVASREKIEDEVMDISTRLIMSPGAAKQISQVLSSAVSTTEKWTHDLSSHPATRPSLDPSTP